MLTRSEWRRCYPCRIPQRSIPQLRRSRNGDQAYREADSCEDREDGEEEGRAEEGGGREIDREEGRLRGGGTQGAREEEGRNEEDRGEESRSEKGGNEEEGDCEEVRRPQGDEQGFNAKVGSEEDRPEGCEENCRKGREEGREEDCSQGRDKKGGGQNHGQEVDREETNCEEIDRKEVGYEEAGHEARRWHRAQIRGEENHRPPQVHHQVPSDHPRAGTGEHPQAARSQEGA